MMYNGIHLVPPYFPLQMDLYQFGHRLIVVCDFHVVKCRTLQRENFFSLFLTTLFFARELCCYGRTQSNIRRTLAFMAHLIKVKLFLFWNFLIVLLPGACRELECFCPWIYRTRRKYKIHWKRIWVWPWRWRCWRTCSWNHQGLFLICHFFWSWIMWSLMLLAEICVGANFSIRSRKNDIKSVCFRIMRIGKMNNIRLFDKAFCTYPIWF